MVTKAQVDNFISAKNLAVVGVSRTKRKFGNMAWKELKKKGYSLYPIHYELKEFDGTPCYANLKNIRAQVDGALIVVSPSQTGKVVRDANDAGIKQVWMQQGSESDEALKFCRENNISAIHGECILMFAEPVGFGHNLHRWIWKLLGKLPN